MYILNDLMQILFPDLCLTCERVLVRGEKYLCMHCLLHLPRTGYLDDPANEVARIFWGRVYIEHATAFCKFLKGGRYQKLIHWMKYRNRPDIARFLGQHFGRALAGTAFEKADVLIPVPLHPSRQRERGYNQSWHIARGMAEKLNKEVLQGILIRNRRSSSQTRKTRLERWENVKDIFRVEQVEAIMHKHILLVDDVVTTGATLEACATELLKVEGVKVSIAVLAVA